MTVVLNNTERFTPEILIVLFVASESNDVELSIDELVILLEMIALLVESPLFNVAFTSCENDLITELTIDDVFTVETLKEELTDLVLMSVEFSIEVFIVSFRICEELDKKELFTVAFIVWVS